MTDLEIVTLLRRCADIVRRLGHDLDAIQVVIDCEAAIREIEGRKDR